jgi:hypothetical protein
MSTPNPETTKRLRINLLRQLRESAPFALPVPALLTGARLEAFDIAQADVVREMEFLSELTPPLATRVKEPFSAAVRRYKITPEGREWLETEGF